MTEVKQYEKESAWIPENPKTFQRPLGPGRVG